MKVKLCGFTEEDSLKTAIAQKCDFIGFIFYDKSPRFISLEKASELSLLIPQNIAKVAVVVNPDLALLERIFQKLNPDFFQFHGEETPDFIFEIRKKFPEIKIIKAFKITKKQDLAQLEAFENCANLFLLDNKEAGSGKKFNWEILKDFSCKKEWFLSGGLNVNNVEEALKITNAKMIDISSGIEEIRGKKSPKLIIEFMNKVKTLCC